MNNKARLVEIRGLLRHSTVAEAVELADELMDMIEQLRGERAIWQGIGEKVQGEYRAIPQFGGGAAWMRASEYGIDYEPLSGDEMRLIFPETQEEETETCEECGHLLDYEGHDTDCPYDEGEIT